MNGTSHSAIGAERGYASTVEQRAMGPGTQAAVNSQDVADVGGISMSAQLPAAGGNEEPRPSGQPDEAAAAATGIRICCDGTFGDGGS